VKSYIFGNGSRILPARKRGQIHSSKTGADKEDALDQKVDFYYTTEDTDEDGMGLRFDFAASATQISFTLPAGLMMVNSTFPALQAAGNSSTYKDVGASAFTYQLLSAFIEARALVRRVTADRIEPGEAPPIQR
jgi:hypothetical protein